MMKILITGHMGLIGSKIFGALRSLHDVDGIDIKDFEFGLDKQKIWDKIDLTFQGFEKKYDMIIHCAAYCVIRDLIKDPNLAFFNIKTTHYLMEFARRTGCKKVVIFSSGRLYSTNKNPYTVSKVYAEETAAAYKECFGIDYMIIRPECVWGEHDNPVRVIPAWIKAAANNQPLLLYGTKEKELSPIYVDDFVSLFLSYLKEWEYYKGRKISITGTPFRAILIAEMIIKVFGSKSEVKMMEAEKSQPQTSSHLVGEDALVSVGSYTSFGERLREVFEHGNITNKTK